MPHLRAVAGMNGFAFLRSEFAAVGKRLRMSVE